MSYDSLKNQVNHLQTILFEEAKKHSIYDPIYCVPKDIYNEILPNIYLGGE